MAKVVHSAFLVADGPREARHQRDSLASRQRTGLPGSRRHRRYLNLAFLTANSSDDDATTELELEERTSPLHQLLTAENRSAWELLREALLNYNYELICRLEAAFFDRFMPGCQMATNPNLAGSGVEVFGYCSFLSASCLPAAARSKLGHEYLVVLLHNSRDRKICHGVSKYYSLLSWSETTNRGQRVTIVVKPKAHTPPLASPPHDFALRC